MPFSNRNDLKSIDSLHGAVLQSKLFRTRVAISSGDMALSAKRDVDANLRLPDPFEEMVI